MRRHSTAGFQAGDVAQWFEDDVVADAWRTVEQAIDELGGNRSQVGVVIYGLGAEGN